MRPDAPRSSVPVVQEDVHGDPRVVGQVLVLAAPTEHGHARTGCLGDLERIVDQPDRDRRARGVGECPERQVQSRSCR